MNAVLAEKMELRGDIVREHTNPEINRRIDEQTVRNIQLYSKADRSLIDHRLRELEREWDMERALEANASTVILTGLFLGTAVSRRWLLLCATAAGFLFHHAVRGWCPPVPILRRRGVRTRREIERERIALKVIRGDFKEFDNADDGNLETLLALIEK